jgi:hypothetical protein
LRSVAQARVFHVVLIIIVGIAAVLGVVFISLHARLNEEGSTIGSFFTSKKPGAQLSLVADQRLYKVNDTFEVDVVLSTSDQEIMGTDVQLSYNPKVLRLEMAGSSADPGMRYLDTKHSVFSSFLGVESDSNSGLFKFSALMNPGERLARGGEVVTLKFKAVGKGNADLKFVYEPKNTTDTNVAASSGKDVLNDVNTIRISVE